MYTNMICIYTNIASLFIYMSCSKRRDSQSTSSKICVSPVCWNICVSPVCWNIKMQLNSLRSRPNPIPRETHGTGTQLSKLRHTRQARTLAITSRWVFLMAKLPSLWLYHPIWWWVPIFCTSKMSTKLSATREWSQGTERMPTISVQNGYLNISIPRKTNLWHLPPALI